MKLFEFDGNWTKEYQFEAFKGLQSRRGSYTSKSSDQISDGTVSLTIIDDTSDSPDPSLQQINAINFLIEYPEDVKDTMRKGIASIYEELKVQYGYDKNNLESTKWFPEIKELSDFDHVFGVGNVYIELTAKDELSYVGIECGCTWDEEHGLGFLLHKNRIVGIGDAAEACSWKSYKDNGTLEEVKEGLKKKSKFEPIKYLPHSKYGKLKPSQKAANESYESNLIRRGFNDKFIKEVERGNIDIDGIYKSIDQSYLELAVSDKNIVLIRFLFDRGVKIRYAFHQTRKDLELIDLLIDNGGNINSKDLGENTILYKETLELVTLYDHRNQSLKYKTDREEELTNKINEQNNFIKQLLIRGADPQIENCYGFNCYNAARNLPKDQQEEIHDFMEKHSKNQKSKNKILNEKKPVKWWEFWRRK